MKTTLQFWMCSIAVAGGLACPAVAQEEKPVNPDLDTEGVKLLVEIAGGRKQEDGTVVVQYGGNAYLERKLSRDPKPRNEWLYDGYGVEKYVDGTGWVMYDSLYVDVYTKGVFELIFRGRMEFFREPIDGAIEEDEVYTPSVQIIMKVS